MACLEMYNNNSSSNGVCSPRISFSNDFVEIRSEIPKRSSPLSKPEGSSSSSSSLASDSFEFSVSNYTMMPADELFSKGKLLPFKEMNQVQRTLRDELLLEEDEEVITTNSIFSVKPPSSKGRWKGLLGLKKAHVGSKNNNDERFVHMFNNNNNKQSQEGIGGRDMKKSM